MYTPRLYCCLLQSCHAFCSQYQAMSLIPCFPFVSPVVWFLLILSCSLPPLVIMALHYVFLCTDSHKTFCDSWIPLNKLHTEHTNFHRVFKHLLQLQLMWQYLYRWRHQLHCSMGSEHKETCSVERYSWVFDHQRCICHLWVTRRVQPEVVCSECQWNALCDILWLHCNWLGGGLWVSGAGVHIFCYGSEAHWKSMGSSNYEHQSRKHLSFVMIKISYTKRFHTGVTRDVTCSRFSFPMSI